MDRERRRKVKSKQQIKANRNAAIQETLSEIKKKRLKGIYLCKQQ